jgi:hypothetical protein
MPVDKKVSELLPGDIFVKPEKIFIPQPHGIGKYALRPVAVMEVNPARTKNVRSLVLRDRETDAAYTVQLFAEVLRTIVRPTLEEAPATPLAHEMHAIRKAIQDFCGAMLDTWLRNDPSRNKAEGQVLFGALLVENAYIMVGIMQGTRAAATLLEPPPNVRATWDMSIEGVRAAIQAFNEQTK